MSAPSKGARHRPGWRSTTSPTGPHTKVTQLGDLTGPCGHHHDLKTHHGYRFGPLLASGKRRLIPPDDTGSDPPPAGGFGPTGRGTEPDQRRTRRARARTRADTDTEPGRPLRHRLTRKPMSRRPRVERTVDISWVSARRSPRRPRDTGEPVESRRVPVRGTPDRMPDSAKRRPGARTSDLRRASCLGVSDRPKGSPMTTTTKTDTATCSPTTCSPASTSGRRSTTGRTASSTRTSRS